MSNFRITFTSFSLIFHRRSDSIGQIEFLSLDLFHGRFRTITVIKSHRVICAPLHTMRGNRVAFGQPPLIWDMTDDNSRKPVKPVRTDNPLVSYLPCHPETVSYPHSNRLFLLEGPLARTHCEIHWGVLLGSSAFICATLAL